MVNGAESAPPTTVHRQLNAQRNDANETRDKKGRAGTISTGIGKKSSLSSTLHAPPQIHVEMSVSEKKWGDEEDENGDDC